MLLISCFSCDSVETDLGGDFKVWEHDVSVTRGLYYRSQGIGPKPLCEVGYDNNFIWVKLCKSKKSISYYLVDRKLYAKDPMQQESSGYWEFTDEAGLREKLLENNIKLKWKKKFHNPYN